MEIKTTLKYGISKDSPFHSQYTEAHPSTKQLLDYAYMNTLPKDPQADLPFKEITNDQLEKLPIAKQEEVVNQRIMHYKSLQRPRIFTKMMRQGLSKEK